MTNVKYSLLCKERENDYTAFVRPTGSLYTILCKNPFEKFFRQQTG